MPYLLRKFVSIWAYSSSEITPLLKRFFAIDMVAWYIVSFSICSLVITATPKSVLYVALMGTILPVLIAISCKRLFTARADIFIIGFSLHLVEMAVPPLISATIRTESLFFSPRCLHNRDSTAKTKMSFCIDWSRRCDHSTKSVSFTISFYCISTYSKSLWYLSIAVTIFSHFLYLLSLCIVHCIHLHRTWRE